MKHFLDNMIVFCNKHWKFYFLLSFFLALFYSCMIKDLRPFVHHAESTYVTADAAFVIDNFRLFPFPHIEFQSDSFGFPYRMQPVFLTWMLEHDFLCGILFKLFGIGPWEQLYWLFTLFLSATVIYYLLRSFGGFEESRAIVFSMAVTFCNYAAICKYPGHYTVAIYHWVIINMVMDFLLIKLYFEKRNVSASFILLKSFFLTMALGVELGYIAGGAFTSFVLTGCFILLWEAASKRSPMAPFAFVGDTLKTAWRDFFEHRINCLLLVMMLIPLCLFFPVAIQIAWIAKHGEVTASCLVQTASTLRALLPIFPGWNPLACPSLGSVADTIYANCTGWTFVFLVLMAFVFGKKRVVWLTPFLLLYLLALFVAKFPVLKCFPWFSYARFSERFSPVLVPCLAMAFLVIPRDLARKFRGAFFCVLLGGLFVVECTYAYKSTFTWIDMFPVVGLDNAGENMVRRIKEMDGQALFSFPFAIAGGDGNAVAGRWNSAALSHSMQIAFFAGKKTNCFYGGRLDRSSGNLPVAAAKDWDTVFGEAATGAVSERNLKILADFVEKNDFCAILLWTNPAWVSLAFCEQMHRRFGLPVATCNYAGFDVELLKVNKRNDKCAYYGIPFRHSSLVPSDVISFPADGRHCATRGFSGVWGCGPRYSLTFSPKTRASKYRIVISALPCLVPEKQEEKVVLIRYDGKVVCTRKYDLAQAESLSDLAFDVELAREDLEDLQLTLDFQCLSKQKSPADCGMSSDARVLSLMFRQLTCCPSFELSAETLPWTVPLHFYGLRSSGFSEEWMISGQNSIRIPISGSLSKDLSVSIDGWGFCWPDMPMQTMTVSSKGRQLASFSYSATQQVGRLRFDIPKELANDGMMSLDFRFENPLKSPKELGLGEDVRTLGYLFKSMSVSGID